ncbi:MAG: hypothetical protein M3P12_04795 [Gemmatimonadota bacterium]|nr:hypothetical protein [Gemmatimonadota bacterium]
MNQPLAETVFWIATVACVIAELAILRSTFAARRGNSSQLMSASSPRAEIAWAIIPAVALGFVLTATWQKLEARDAHMRMMDHSGLQHSMPMPAAFPRPQS